ncbi:hypothetical protein V1512DRAFT_47675 [Lipomyces arxii]|uniref:mitochondrial 54S ribosomal protein uL10m n=1 Tax=Lipomyces arxii TaxID=56418 RepID=UPI0034CEA436
MLGTIWQITRQIQNGLRGIQGRTFATIVRDTVKPVDSRKTYLMDRYSYLIKNKQVLVFVQHNNLMRQDSLGLRQQIQRAGGDLTILRLGVFKVALRNGQHDDPASKAAQKIGRKVRHPANRLLSGPTAVISFSSLDPTGLKSAIDVVERSQGRLLLLGAYIDARMFNKERLEYVKELKPMGELQSELAGVLEVLRGGGLVNTLSSVSTGLYLTMNERRKQLDGGSESE